MLGAEQKKAVMEKYRRHDKDTASPEVQIALITARIENISQHLQTFRKDHKSKRSLLQLVGQRKRLLRYLHNTDIESFHKLLESLGIRASF
ncbi:SSU ribosomal protein S15P [Brevinema andersonii]|uniref:Small ribosomal subunit protein uS15 n=1 Tax=Brevinema andersonii TaxID=34097 RepID=A0A1I1D934_BREAD|nr:30S ribosomal protein S15 [Brevinema andersonii]SFB70846.1 SSU ribosomal protein S15P [Brevinema andersonii]